MSAPIQNSARSPTDEVSGSLAGRAPEWAGGPVGATVLIVDDDPDFVAIFGRLLVGAGFTVEGVGSAAACRARVARSDVDVVCLDLGLPDSDGLVTLRALRALDPRLPVVILTADSAVGTVVAAMHEGAYDYLVKSVDRTKLLTTMKNAVERRRLETRIEALQHSSGGGGRFGMVGATPAMQDLFGQLERVAPSGVNVAIVGESGAGKELVARALHDASPRRSGSWVAINCAAIPETLQEAELFGHEKGAFTGALTRRAGRLEQADGGTLFLDEVAELSLSLQAKLLRALQERRFCRVGGSVEVASDFRLVTASHKDLALEVAAGRFREDLYYRLVVFELRVPALRDRREDIPLLAHHFLARFATDGVPLRLSSEALETFLAHPWRGNVRELQNAIQHAAVIARGGVIRREDLPARLRTAPVSVDVRATPVDIEPPPPALPPPALPSPALSSPALSPPALLSPALPPPALPPPALPSPPPSTAPGDDPVLPVMSLEQLERLAIQQAIDRHQGNVSAAIRELGLGRTTMYRKLQEYGIRVAR
jgi:two-component system, NtrC family, response regulator HydG